MTPKLSVEIAYKIHEIIDRASPTWFPLTKFRIYELIGQIIDEALTQYAERRVKESSHCCQEPRVAHAKARAEALEEAAKMADAHQCYEPDSRGSFSATIASKIRSLKGAPKP